MGYLAYVTHRIFKENKIHGGVQLVIALCRRGSCFGKWRGYLQCIIEKSIEGTPVGHWHVFGLSYSPLSIIKEAIVYRDNKQKVKYL